MFLYWRFSLRFPNLEFVFRTFSAKTNHEYGLLHAETKVSVYEEKYNKYAAYLHVFVSVNYVLCV